MKNTIYKYLLLLSIIIFSSCSKDLEYGSDFEFKINNLDNNSIVINTDKTFTLELTKFFNQTNNRTFKLSYECDKVVLIDNNITLLQNTDYTFSFNELKLLPLKLVALEKGDLTLNITLTDENGLKKQQKIIVKAIQDLNFSLVTNDVEKVYEKTFGDSFNFTMNLTNIGSSADKYIIKAFSSLGGTILINSNLVEQNQSNPVVVGNISISFTPKMLNEQTLTVVVVNSDKVEKEISFNLKVNQKVFTISPIASFQTKQTLASEFKFITNNTVSEWQYQVKFNSETSAKIYTTTGAPIPLDTYVNLPLNTNEFTFKYLSNITSNDNINITIKDPNGQIVTSKTAVTVISKPTINQVIALVEQYNNWSLISLFKISGAKAYGSGVTITDYEFKILNYKTGTYDLYLTSENNSIYPNDNSTAFYFLNNVHSKITNEDRNINWYWNQPYTARVKDSDGVWSEIISGTMTY